MQSRAEQCRAESSLVRLSKVERSVVTNERLQGLNFTHSGA